MQEFRELRSDCAGFVFDVIFCDPREALRLLLTFCGRKQDSRYCCRDQWRGCWTLALQIHHGGNIAAFARRTRTLESDLLEHLGVGAANVVRLQLLGRYRFAGLNLAPAQPGNVGGRDRRQS